MTPDTSGSGFPPQEKLKSRKAIQFLFESGSTAVQHPLKAIYLFKAEVPHLVRFGVSVPKRSTPKAIHRNKIKRKIREAYRLQKRELNQICFEKKTGLDMMWIYIGKSELEFQEGFDSASKLIQKIKSKVEKLSVKAL